MLFLKGLVLGFSIAAPVGPIGVLCIQRAGPKPARGSSHRPRPAPGRRQGGGGRGEGAAPGTRGDARRTGGGIHATPSGEVWQTNPVTAEAKLVFDTLGIKPQPRYYTLPTTHPNHV